MWTPDGRHLVFLNSGFGTLYLGDASGSEVETVKLTDQTRNQLAQDWTASGDRLIYENWNADTGIDLVVLQPASRSIERLVWNTSANEFGARLAPGDQWLAYVTDQTGRNEVWVTAFPSGQPRRQISLAGGSHPAWKGDGTELISSRGWAVGRGSVPCRRGSHRCGTRTNLFYSRHHRRRRRKQHLRSQPRRQRFRRREIANRRCSADQRHRELAAASQRDSDSSEFAPRDV